jgi:cytosine/adenosine deaminase-related metal-dependent hydrolase
MAGPTVDNGAVAISGDRIAAVGAFDEIMKSNTGDVLDLGERILLPGLINAHCHLDYTGLRGRIEPKNSFTDWIHAINAAREKLKPSDYLSSIECGLSEAARFGTTSIINFEAFPELPAQTTSPLRVWWLGELIDVRAPDSGANLADRTAQSLNQPGRWGLAPHAPFTASELLYRRCQEIAVRANVALSTHVAESREEMEMFRDRTGPLFQFLESIGRDMADCGNTTPLCRFLQVVNDGRPNDLSRWLVVHLNELSNNDMEMLSRLDSKFHVVHCPRSHRYFGHTPFQYQRLRDLGFNVCVGTDSLASNDNLDMLEEILLFIELHPGVSSRDILEMVTVNPARALQCEDLIGQIRPGSHADLIGIADSRTADAFENVIALGSVNWRMIGGCAVPG